MSGMKSRQRGFLLNPARFSSGGPTNPYIANLKALYHFDGTDGATSTSDASPVSRSITLGNSAQIDTAQSKFGVSSLYLVQASQSYALMPASADFNLGTADFTIRFWVRKDNDGANGSFRRIFQTVDGDVVSGLSLADNRANGNLSWSISSTGTTQNILADFDAGTLALDAWTHIAIERASNQIGLYVGGTRVDTRGLGGISTYYNAAFDWTLGGQSTGTNRTFDGWIDEFEFYAGVALAGGATSYVPPSAPSLP